MEGAAFDEDVDVAQRQRERGEEHAQDNNRGGCPLVGG